MYRRDTGPTMFFISLVLTCGKMILVRAKLKKIYRFYWYKLKNAQKWKCSEVRINEKARNLLYTFDGLFWGSLSYPFHCAMIVPREICYWINFNWKKFLFVRSLSLPHVVNRNFNSPLAQFVSCGPCSVPTGEAASANIHITVHEKCGIVQEVWCTKKERKTIRTLWNIVPSFFETFS